ncbi:hypothetical protein CTAYLR_009611 [Chrysophaeum taylorii]|uniref:Thioredoxin domain-containing protein n=1 Tax=Chrysophaeum taylorii TaxID=2483200 RepID=A0AAD7UNS2_9STRA|nr:hypothetical protein CTAYLR_009611 [Chrysophaeum taylorii]
MAMLGRLLLVAVVGAALRSRPTQRREALRVRGGDVEQPSDLEAFHAAIKADKIVVIDFSATWCGPCKMIGPAFASLAQQMPEVGFVKVDVDEVPEASAEYDVSALPTFVFLKEGAEVARFSGASLSKLRDTLADVGATVPSNDIF